MGFIFGFADDTKRMAAYVVNSRAIAVRAALTTTLSLPLLALKGCVFVTTTSRLSADFVVAKDELKIACFSNSRFCDRLFGCCIDSVMMRGLHSAGATTVIKVIW